MNISKNIENFSKNLKTLRRNFGMQQVKLADKIPTSRSSVIKWEKGYGEPKIGDVVRLAEIFNISIEELVFGNIEEVAFDFGKNIEKVKQLNTAPSNNMREGYTDKKRAIPLINPKNREVYNSQNREAYKAFEEAYEYNIHWENTGDDSKFEEMMILYQRAFRNGIIEAGINILNVVTCIMGNIKKNTPEHDLIFDDVLIKYIEELEEACHPAGKFFRVYALGEGLLDNGENQDENLDDGVFLMIELAENGNKYAKNFLSYISGLV